MNNELFFQLFSFFIFLLILPVFWLFYRQISSEKRILISPSSLLLRYSKDLTKLAEEKKLDPVIGREREISRVVEILSRRTKNNPVLIGAAGVGKTAIVEGLALRIISKKVPPSLYGKKVLALDLASILAGTKYRGEFEQRLKKITDEIVASKKLIILFIDEIHILANAGEAEGAINAADILKPLLARGELQVVGATTKDEYFKFIKQDKTLDRRLQPIFVSEPTPAETEIILNGIKDIYEKYHRVEILPETLKEAVTATKVIKDRSYPDKAIDAIDEACSRVHLDNLSLINKKKIQVKPQDIKMVIKEWKV